MDREIFDDLTKDQRRDMNEAMKYTKIFFTVLGLWPCVIKNPSKIQSFVRLTIPLPSIVIIFLVIPIITHLIVRDVPRPQLIVLLGPIGFRLANILKNVALVYRRESIKWCIEHMERDWRGIDPQNTKDREIMLKNLRTGKFLTYVCAASMYSSAIFYQAIMPLLRGKTVNEFNVTIKPLIFPGADLFVDTQAGYNYEIVFVCNCIAAFFLYTIVTTVCNLAAILVSHACGQIQIIISRLENLNDFDNNEKQERDIEEEMIFVIKKHVKVLGFTSKINDILREMCLVEVVASTIIICLLEYYCMTEWKNSSTVAIVTYVMLLISLCFNIFIFCHIGELLKEQCEQIGRTAYMTNWYHLPKKIALALVMIIAMANQPRKLTAGRMMELSIYSFGSIIKTSVAYLNMLQAVAE